MLAFLDAAIVRNRPIAELQERVLKLRARLGNRRHNIIYDRLGELCKDVFQNHLSIVYGETYLDTSSA